MSNIAQSDRLNRVTEIQSVQCVCVCRNTLDELQLYFFTRTTKIPSQAPYSS